MSRSTITGCCEVMYNLAPTAHAADVAPITDVFR